MIWQNTTSQSQTTAHFRLSKDQQKTFLQQHNQTRPLHTMKDFTSVHVCFAPALQRDYNQHKILWWSTTPPVTPVSKQKNSGKHRNWISCYVGSVWLGGAVVSTLGMRTRRLQFESRVVPLFHWVATLGKLFTHIASPVSQLQETRVQKGVFGA